jgi:hypothetical protein
LKSAPADSKFTAAAKTSFPPPRCKTFAACCATAAAVAYARKTAFSAANARLPIATASANTLQTVAALPAPAAISSAALACKPAAIAAIPAAKAVAAATFASATRRSAAEAAKQLLN